MEKITQFLLKARTKTYAGSAGKTKAVLNGSTQLEWQEGDWFYRDVYYTGKGIFMGLEVIHCRQRPVWAMSYYGNFKGMREQEMDSILREALLANWQETRTWNKVEWEKNGYQYICEPDFQGSIEEMAGVEKVLKNKKEIYKLFYAGGLISSF